MAKTAPLKFSLLANDPSKRASSVPCWTISQVECFFSAQSSFPLNNEAFWGLRTIHCGGMDVSGITQQELAVLPLDFLILLYKYIAFKFSVINVTKYIYTWLDLFVCKLSILDHISHCWGQIGISGLALKRAKLRGSAKIEFSGSIQNYY